MPAIPHLEQPLSDGHVLVRDYAERDIPEILIAYQDDPELHRRIGQERPPSGAQLGRWAEQEPGERAAGMHASFTVLEPSSDVCRGQVNLHKVDWEHARAELGIWLVPQVRGGGLGSRALRLVGAWLFGATPLARLQLMTDPDNEAMVRAARSAGFTYEGVLRSYSREGSERADNVVFSLLPSDLVS
jgi:RimJ/RimL family protein N-acetyltransferase